MKAIDSNDRISNDLNRFANILKNILEVLRMCEVNVESAFSCEKSYYTFRYQIGDYGN